MTETVTVRNGIDVDQLLATIDAIKARPARSVAHRRPPGPALKLPVTIRSPHDAAESPSPGLHSSPSTRILLT